MSHVFVGLSRCHVYPMCLSMYPMCPCVCRCIQVPGVSHVFVGVFRCIPCVCRCIQCAHVFVGVSRCQVCPLCLSVSPGVSHVIVGVSRCVPFFVGVYVWAQVCQSRSCQSSGSALHGEGSVFCTARAMLCHRDARARAMAGATVRLRQEGLRGGMRRASGEEEKKTISVSSAIKS